jgi:hypothetical protein
VPYNETDRNTTSRRISRRAALQLGIGAGTAAIAAPYVSRRGRLGGAVDLGSARPVLVPNPSWPVPPIVTRAQWGANESLRKPGQVYDAPVKKIIVHHTATPNDVTNYAALCRGILANETAGEYIDIAYNWLIDPLGNIYEGRWAQNYAAGAPHTGERSGKNVRGGHALNHNVSTIGVALMGNYDQRDPSPAMVNALVTLLAWKCARWGLDPLGRGTYVAGNGAVENLYNISGHRDVNATACPGGRVQPLLPSIRSKVAARLSGGGYWIASNIGQVLAFGGVPAAGSTIAPVVGIAGQPSGGGYWLVTADGAVFSFGSARYHGGMNGKRLNAPIVGIASTRSGEGYWLVGGDGGIFSFGDARFHGSTGGMRLNAPVLGMLPTTTGRGYWVYARDGGVFTFGDARFRGSTGGMRLNQPVVSMAARPQGDGYWLVAADGGVFSFGQARFRGSGANSGLRSPCVGMLPSTTGNGYVLLRRDGTVSAYGDAPNLGSATGLIAGTAAGIAGRLKPL